MLNKFVPVFTHLAIQNLIPFSPPQISFQHPPYLPRPFGIGKQTENGSK
jgi:ubiquitin-protein ligase